jgi:MazG family protein
VGGADPAEIREALGRLDELTRRLRRECPWDREQDERSIVPHTLEEAYELADAAQRGDDAKLLDELGDVLFQVHFLALLLEERGAGDLAAVADACRAKLIRRHPHVFGDAEVAGAADVLRNWDLIKQAEPDREAGIFGEVPGVLPSLLYARKLQRRAGLATDDAEQARAAAEHALTGVEASGGDAFASLGELLFRAVALARALGVDPELALRAAADRFGDGVLAAEGEAARTGRAWDDLSPQERRELYERAAATPRQGGEET